MASEPTFWGVPLALTALNVCLTVGVVMIAGGRIAAAVVFVPVHVALRWFASDRLVVPANSIKEI